MTNLNIFGDRCIYKKGNNQYFKLAEMHTEYRVRNIYQKEYITYSIDGGIIPQNTNTTKCDFLLITQDTTDTHKGIFIELKGKNVEHALEQIDSTLRQLGSVITDYYKQRSLNYRYYGRVIARKGVSQANCSARHKQLFENLKRRLKKEFHGDMLKIEKSGFEESI